ncbi:MAG TPA: glycosyltransferase family 4 protein [Actinomycetota bacterium]|nr:glycosyltransferase family 4 protein [Actinomycetota bacterium]
MRVALVCPYAWDRFGGVQSHVRSLAGALGERGHEVRVLAPHVGPRAVAPEGVTFTGKAVPIPANGSVAALAFGPAAAAAVKRALTEFEPDVLHLHEPLIPSISLLALRSSDVPAVGTFHAAMEWSFGYGIARSALGPTIRRLAVRTVVSDSAEALVSRYFPGPYVLTPNGIDVDAFARAEPERHGGGSSVLFFSRLEKRKGLEVLIRAVAGLRDGPVRPTLVVAGAGPEERAVKSLARSLSVRAVWLGRVPDERVASLYRGADVYCAPALGGESFGIVLVEAMAAGAPVVCSDLPGFRAVAGEAAFLVPPRAHRRLGAALRRVLEDPAKAETMRTAGRDVAARFDWSRLVPRVEELYESARRAPSSARGTSSGARRASRSRPAR